MLTGQPTALADLVSIVIVGYNNWPDLEMAIHSALGQSYRPIEVIVVDNSSSDATPEEVPRRFGDAVRYVRQANVGDGGAYNTGFELAAGEFIQFLDGDDVLAPNKIERQVEVFRCDPAADIVYGDIRQFQTRAGRARWTEPVTRERDDMLVTLIDPQGQGAGLSALGTLFRRRALERVGPWDHSLWISDQDYWLRAAWAGCRFHYRPGSPMGFSRRRAGQMSADTSGMMREMEPVWAKALGYITCEPYRGRLARRLAQLRFYLAVSSNGLTSRQALAKLALAHATCPGAAPPLAYLIARLLIVSPGRRWLVTTPWLALPRRALALALGFDYAR